MGFADLCRLPAPEQNFAQLAVGQTVDIAVDAFPGKAFSGHVKFLDARVSTDTRNFLVRAEIANPDRSCCRACSPTCRSPPAQPRKVVTLPSTAIAYSLYGDSVYV